MKADAGGCYENKTLGGYCGNLTAADICWRRLRPISRQSCAAQKSFTFCQLQLSSAAPSLPISSGQPSTTPGNTSHFRKSILVKNIFSPSIVQLHKFLKKQDGELLRITAENFHLLTNLRKMQKMTIVYLRITWSSLRLEGFYYLTRVLARVAAASAVS